MRTAISGTRVTRLAAWLLAAYGASAPGAASALSWETVVNNGVAGAGGAPGEFFFSYNQPSINDAGLVVFRARAKTAGGGGGGGGAGEPLRGIFTRDMGTPGSAIEVIASNRAPFDTVAGPNNLGATYTEFPSFPRIDARSSMVAFRGQSEPVLEYQTGVNPDGTPVTTRGGTSGIYANPGGSLRAGATQLGNVNNSVYGTNPDLSHFQVPGTAAGTKFDQFPGAPAVTGGNTVVFKGNWTDSGGASHTGIYYRNLLAQGGTAPVELIASSGQTIPGYGGALVFGSTAPPSAANGKVVFTGLDNEDAPTAGGVYVAALAPSAALTPLAQIGITQVPGSGGQTLTTVGEGLSFDGHNAAFWGAWGTEMRTVTVTCPTDGQAAVIAACLNGDTNGTPGDGIYQFQVSKNQGIFVANVDTGAVTLQAQTGAAFQDFVYWNFSGAPPGQTGGDGDAEPPRWRSASFVAGLNGNTVFKALSTSGADGLYGSFGGHVSTVLETGTDGALVDTAASGMRVTELGIERESLRNGRLAINAGMLNAATGESWAGIYVTAVPEPGTYAMFIAGLAAVGFTAARKRRRR